MTINEKVENSEFLDSLQNAITRIEDSYQPNLGTFKPVLEPLTQGNYEGVEAKMQNQIIEVYKSLDNHSNKPGVLMRLKSVHKEYADSIH